MRKGSVTKELERMVNRAKSRVRTRVEHVFGDLKRLWGFDKVRYRGLAKNATRSFAALGSDWRVPPRVTTGRLNSRSCSVLH